MRFIRSTITKTGLQIVNKKTVPLKFIVSALIAVILIAPLYQLSNASADWQPVIQVVSPTSSSLHKGSMTLSFTVTGLSPNQYEPFWAVGNGTWNRMTTANELSSSQVDTSDWNWNANGSYDISFIALKKSDWQPIILKKTITMSDPVLTSPVNVGVSMSPQPSPPTNPATPANTLATVSNETLYRDPTSDVQAQAKAWVQAHPSDSVAMNKLISEPLANWYGGWNKDIQKDTNRYVSDASAAGQVPVLVAYNIPHRDCGSYSAGGLSDAQAYASWITQFADGVGHRNAIVLLEPDALAGMDCLSPSDQVERVGMLHEAVMTLKSLTNAKVYLDAGHPDWQSTSVMANRLTQAGIDQADGFSLNISNFINTDNNIIYGTELSAKINNAHFVVDTSRNGNGAAPNGEWCNPSGVKIGNAPTLTTGHELVDAYLWVKSPGESDGSCGEQQAGTNAPPAGEWWPQYALSLLN